MSEGNYPHTLVQTRDRRSNPHLTASLYKFLRSKSKAEFGASQAGSRTRKTSSCSKTESRHSSPCMVEVTRFYGILKYFNHVTQTGFEPAFSYWNSMAVKALPYFIRCTANSIRSFAKIERHFPYTTRIQLFPQLFLLSYKAIFKERFKTIFR